MPFARLFWAFSIAACTLAARADDPVAEKPIAPAGILELTNGDAVKGEFRPSPSPDVIRWQGSGFVEPFEFPPAYVKNISFPAQTPVPKLEGELFVELAGGDLLAGRILEWSSKAVAFESVHFGTIHVHPNSVRRLFRLGQNPYLVYLGPKGMAGWQDPLGGWKDDGGAVATEGQDAPLSADLHVPARARIEFEISWNAHADFELAFGVDPDPKARSSRDGWRFVTWGEGNACLAAVHENRLRADVCALLNFSQPKPDPVRPSVTQFRSGIALNAGINR
jgi:hypothetical protein